MCGSGTTTYTPTTQEERDAMRTDIVEPTATRKAIIYGKVVDGEQRLAGKENTKLYIQKGTTFRGENGAFPQEWSEGVVSGGVGRPPYTWFQITTDAGSQWMDSECGYLDRFFKVYHAYVFRVRETQKWFMVHGCGLREDSLVITEELTGYILTTDNKPRVDKLVFGDTTVLM